MDYVFSPPPVASIAVGGSDARIPVRRVFCVGRNYADHAKEMGFDSSREPPFFFTKPADAVIDDGATIPYPPETENLHFEAELVVIIGKGGSNIAQKDSLDHVWGYACGNDLTRRDLQIRSRDMGRPWDWGKGFDRSAPIGPARPVSETGHLSAGSIRLTVNGEVKQDGDLSDLIWNVPEIIAIMSQSMELQPGDLIMTGTPAGVGPLQPGDVCTISIVGLPDLTTTIAPRA